MKIDSKFVRFDSNYRVESNFSDAGFVQNSFDLKICDLIQKVKNNSKNLIKINSKFVWFRFDSTSNTSLIWQIILYFFIEVKLIQFKFHCYFESISKFCFQMPIKIGTTEYEFVNWNYLQKANNSKWTNEVNFTP